MKAKRYKQIRALIAIFIALIVSAAINLDNYLLAVVAVVTGMIFLSLARTRTKIIIDEREKTVREKAAQTAFSIFLPTIGLGSFFLFLLARKEFLFIESLGIIFSYLTLFLISVYAISFYFINKKYGGGGSEK